VHRLDRWEFWGLVGSIALRGVFLVEGWGVDRVDGWWECIFTLLSSYPRPGNSAVMEETSMFERESRKLDCHRVVCGIVRVRRMQQSKSPGRVPLGASLKPFQAANAEPRRRAFRNIPRLKCWGLESSIAFCSPVVAKPQPYLFARINTPPLPPQHSGTFNIPI
jgi:hypothetical protein